MHYWQCLLAVLAGSMLPLQAAINGQLRIKLESPWYATLVSVLVSTLGVAVFCLLIRAPLPMHTHTAQTQWWMWSGGLLGVVFVCASLSLAPILGSTTLAASVIAGQLICSLILDQFGFVGIPIHPINLGRILGLILLVTGVVLIQRN
ncbi:MAG: DMT family transporter [Candidatus Obscuribacterales bacterium]|jgi:transporter family-2 protein|nr:DMT family transporter [Candidatus Obscuribacterales bacterium]